MKGVMNQHEGAGHDAERFADDDAVSLQRNGGDVSLPREHDGSLRRGMQQTGDYFELHAQSAFSFLRGASLPETLVATGTVLGLRGLALCDRMGVYGAPRLRAAARE